MGMENLQATTSWYLYDRWCIMRNTYNSCRSLRQEPSQINVILQQKLPTAKLSAVCIVYKQWLYVLLSSWLQLWLKNRCKTQDTIPYFSYCSYCFWITTNITVIIQFFLLLLLCLYDKWWMKTNIYKLHLLYAYLTGHDWKQTFISYVLFMTVWQVMNENKYLQVKSFLCLFDRSWMKTNIYKLHTSYDYLIGHER